MSKKIRVYNDRIRINGDDRTLYVRVDDDGDIWLDEPSSDVSILLDKAMAAPVANAILRARRF